jgi:hypothetical protein
MVSSDESSGAPPLYRIVHQRPERVSLQLLSALCDIFGCGVEDLVTVTATDTRRRKTATSPRVAAPNVVELNKSVRPGRARIISDDNWTEPALHPGGARRLPPGHSHAAGAGGCPDGRWTDSTHKTTAKSLQNRRLVTVTMKSRWNATIDPAGVRARHQKSSEKFGFLGDCTRCRMPVVCPVSRKIPVLWTTAWLLSRVGGFGEWSLEPDCAVPNPLDGLTNRLGVAAVDHDDRGAVGEVDGNVSPQVSVNWFGPMIAS